MTFRTPAPSGHERGKPMDRTTKQRITRMRETLSVRDNDRQIAEDGLKDFMKKYMKNAGRKAIGQAAKMLHEDYKFNKGLCEAYHKADHDGAPLEGDVLKELKDRVRTYLKANKAYYAQEEKLRSCVWDYLGTNDIIKNHDMQALDEVIDMMPAGYLRFNLFEEKYQMEERMKGNA